MRHRVPRDVTPAARSIWHLPVWVAVVMSLMLAGTAAVAASDGRVPIISDHFGGRRNNLPAFGHQRGIKPSASPGTGATPSPGGPSGGPIVLPSGSPGAPGTSPAPSGPNPPGGGGGGGGGNPPPVIGAGGTLCGASFVNTGGQSYMDAFTAEQNYIGGLRSVRVFYPGAPAAWPGNAGNVDRTVIVSFKFNPSDVVAGRDDATMKSWFDNAPSDRDIYWSYWHEPEDDIANGSFTAAQYKAAWTHLAALARQANNPHLHATLILMNWTVAASSGRNWQDYYPGDSVIDVLGWDVYNWNFKKGSYAAPSNLLDRVIAASASVGKPWGVAELGGAKVSSDPNGTARAAWLASMVTAMQQGGALWVSYFDIDWQNGAYDYRLRDNSSEQVWRSFCSAPGGSDTATASV